MTVKVFYAGSPVLTALSPESAQEYVDQHPLEMRERFTVRPINDHAKAAATARRPGADGRSGQDAQ